MPTLANQLSWEDFQSKAEMFFSRFCHESCHRFSTPWNTDGQNLTNHWSCERHHITTLQQDFWDPRNMPSGRRNSDSLIPSWDGFQSVWFGPIFDWEMLGDLLLSEMMFKFTLICCLCLRLWLKDFENNILRSNLSPPKVVGKMSVFFQSVDVLGYIYIYTILFSKSPMQNLWQNPWEFLIKKL